jgi:hypothetical protein
MALSTRITSAPDVTPATRTQYQRALCLLPLAWPKILRDYPDTSSDAHVVVASFLSKQPGRIMRQGIRKQDPRKGDGLAEELGWSRYRVFRAIKQARAIGLLLSLRYTRADELPTKRRSKTTLLRYFVNVAVIERYALDGAPNAPSDGAPSAPSTGSLRNRDTSTPTPSRAAHRRQRRSQAPSAPRTASETPLSAPDNPNDPTKTDRPNDESLRGQAEQNTDQIAALVSRWNALGLRNANGSASTCGPSERSALANRLADVGPELVELAIDGAGTDPWLRNGGPRSPLAWVMADAESVRRFAEHGAALRRGATDRARAHALADRAKAIWARSPWAPRSAPEAFRDAMSRGDTATSDRVFDAAERLYDAAERILDGTAEDPLGLVHAGDSLATVGPRGHAAPAGPTRVAPTVARNFARMLDRAADLEELRGAAGQPLLNEPGANDT